jgi:transcriptional regulator with XRE-family HTH domain
MVIAGRLRSLREEKQLSQGDIEKRTGLLRCYISRVENGHTVPAIETLEKMARAMEVPLYQLFYDGEEPPQPPALPRSKAEDHAGWGHSGKHARVLSSAGFSVEWRRRTENSSCRWLKRWETNVGWPSKSHGLVVFSSIDEGVVRDDYPYGYRPRSVAQQDRDADR